MSNHGTGDGGSAPPDSQEGTAGDPSEPRPRRPHLDDLRQRLDKDGAVSAQAAARLGHATEAIHLELVGTGLQGERVLVGHVMGMHLLLHAEGLHGPREAPALVYLFADALAVRPTDDAPMSTVPLFGLHMVLPPLAMARWLYKAGRIEHANDDLIEDAQRFEASLAGWTVDEFALADEKLQVFRTADIGGPVHIYQHLAFARVWVPQSDGRPLRLKSAAPTTAEAFVKLEELFRTITWPHGLSTAPPSEPSEDA